MYFTFIIVAILAFNAVEKKGQDALDISNENQQVLTQLKSEKVCSESNRGEACRDLFNRLATSISEKQRLRLACVILNVEGERKTMERLGCPPIKPNPGANP